MHSRLGPPRIVQNGSATIAYAVEGKAAPVAPVICLIASTGRGPEDFAPLAQLLAAGGLRVVMPWPRSIGGSEGPLEDVDFHDLAADAAAALEKEAGTGGAVVAGHAYGGWIARTMAQDRPDLIDGLVLLAAGAGKWPAELSRAIEIAMSQDALEHDRLAALRLAFFAEGNDAHQWLDGWHPRLVELQRAARARTDEATWLPSGHAPVLDIVGLQDPFRPAADRDFYVKTLGRRVTLKTIDGASHALPDERPQEVAEYMLGWINSVLKEKMRANVG